MGHVNLAMFGIWELVIVLLIVVVIFGAGKLPQLGEGLGKAIRNFKRSTSRVEGLGQSAKLLVGGDQVGERGLAATSGEADGGGLTSEDRTGAE